MFFEGRISSNFFEHSRTHGHGLLTYRGLGGMCNIFLWIIEGLASIIVFTFILLRLKIFFVFVLKGLS